MSLERTVDRITFDRERVHGLWPELRPLLHRHWQEIAHYQDIPLDVNEPFYEALEDAGALRIFTARADSGLVGYAVFIVRRNLHYSGSLQAVQDVLFLAPELRGHKVGLQFLTWCDEQLRKDGVQVVYHHVKLAHDFGPALVKYLGYERIETIYGRRLDGCDSRNRDRAD